MRTLSSSCPIESSRSLERAWSGVAPRARCSWAIWKLYMQHVCVRVCVRACVCVHASVSLRLYTCAVCFVQECAFVPQEDIKRGKQHTHTQKQAHNACIPLGLLQSFLLRAPCPIFGCNTPFPHPLPTPPQLTSATEPKAMPVPLSKAARQPPSHNSRLLLPPSLP